MSMGMIGYINAIKRGLRDEYGFKPQPGSTEVDPLVNPPDGTYPLKIDGQVDYVRIESGRIHCCNFEKPSGVELAKSVKKGPTTSDKKWWHFW